MQKVLFIDRDGTLVVEPPEDKQLDSFEKLEFYPGVFQWLARIATELDYELVMVTNQDGLGTPAFPEEKFWPVHNAIIKAFANEGITFADIFIDRSLPAEKAPTRKPGTGMLGKYLHGPYDLPGSFVIGDRLSDIQLAKNLGAQGIFLGRQCQQAALTTTSWAEIYRFLKKRPRQGKASRKTNETVITTLVDLDGSGQSDIATGLGFFDHMLEQVARHGQLDITLQAQGDLHVDEHHTIEDTALTLGMAIDRALGNKKGIERYGFVLPMDEALAQVAVDFSGRPYLVWQADFKREKIGDMPTEMFEHFFKSFSDAACCTLHITATGRNEHHKIEAVFKAFGKALQMAVARSGKTTIPSTKGQL